MGGLHEGHISLVEHARKDCDVVVVSIFVNPTQFNDPADLRNYPRDVEGDLKLLSGSGADLVFVPSVEEIYPVPDRRVFDFGDIDKTMEGSSRPGHFNGVAQVVSRLFDIVEPDVAYFGLKDFQQVAVVRALVAKMGYRVEIIACPTVREEDGLALSSRNRLLDPAHRAAAPLIYRTLKEGAALRESKSIAEVKEYVVETINANPLLQVIYFQIVDAVTLREVSSWKEAAVVQGCIAVQAGSVRLIDNLEY